jgi:hypothetical protein
MKYEIYNLMFMDLLGGQIERLLPVCDDFAWIRFFGDLCVYPHFLQP